MSNITNNWRGKIHVINNILPWLIWTAWAVLKQKHVARFFRHSAELLKLLAELLVLWALRVPNARPRVLKQMFGRVFWFWHYKNIWKSGLHISYKSSELETDSFTYLLSILKSSIQFKSFFFSVFSFSDIDYYIKILVFYISR